MKPYIDQADLNAARLHLGRVPFYLPNRFIGITRGNNIYFRPGAYNPSTASGLALLGHELVHVGQYRQGMNWVKYLWSARTGYENSPYEQAAVQVQNWILNDLATGKVVGLEGHYLMTDDSTDDRWSLERAIDIARKTLDGEYDLLLACRDLAALREPLSLLPEDVLDTFGGVASEVDGLPLGSEREYWAADALKIKDAEAEEYREQVRSAVTRALQKLLSALVDRL